jgi:hypothetical protein
MRSTSTLSFLRLQVDELTNMDRDEDGFLYVSYSGENTFGLEGLSEDA